VLQQDKPEIQKIYEKLEGAGITYSTLRLLFNTISTDYNSARESPVLYKWCCQYIKYTDSLEFLLIGGANQ
jgi:hypothetical protein